VNGSNLARSVETQLRREQKLVHLQFVGDWAGTPAGELAPGDRLMWNGGAVYVVLSVREVSPAFIEITERDERKPDGTVYPRKLKKDRLVVRAKAGEKFTRGRIDWHALTSATGGTR
jgi:hypothetical protein